MRKILTEISIVAIFAFLVSILFFQVLTVRKTIDENNQLQQKVDYLNQTIGEYRNNEEWLEDYIDVLEDIYEGKINEAVLEERIYWLERDNTFNENNVDGYYLLEVVNRIRTRTGDAYVYTLRVYGSDDTVAFTNSQLFSVGEFVLAIETNKDKVYLIDFDN